ncbi:MULTISPECIES: (2Fe-2S)-binding protein [unclassified Methylophaga]|jgi:bacterioferritin-associated ferredoxin|uniref:(2Fe-2S)-binding protein n=1 Tax=unclassified Methylophaga TaxID=2629249 RepID=UPI000C98B088|nr:MULTISPECIES: (2Fe-2S)-binding protein [unclassified Methylophaga]MAP27828.1 NAD(P)H-nitrite reductase [Methylophaga sp.]HBX60481.1 NAD(P)H-nitrite reductase [Methylophaga sp.]HCN99356.1 NAD(P)H-nitrite reductase [Methylophaga sp.]|tara:strand:- start:3147 stop:3365 length:219 start_codon:yes stop_codon:yes gene_type:complete
MIVCVCNNVNVDKVKASIDAGADSLEAIRECTGAAASCGKCQFKVNRVLQQHAPQLSEQDNFLVAQTVNGTR